jgi:hypothetical protein
LPRCPWVGCLCFFINDKTFWPWTGEFEANISDVKGLVWKLLKWPIQYVS